MKSDVRDGPALPGPVVFFDGECPMCNAAVRFIMRHDRHEVFRFAPLGSTLARRVITPAYGQGKVPDSVILFDQGKVLDRSSAVLAVLALLPPPWRGLRHAGVLPRSLLDHLYAAVARCRRLLATGKPSCQLPPPAQRHRFIS